MGDGFGVVEGGSSSWGLGGWSWMDPGSGSASGSDSGMGAGEGDFGLTGALGGPAHEPDFPEVEARVLDLNEAASVADISTISESSSDKTTCFLPLRADCFLGFSDGTVALCGSGLGTTEDLVDLRVGTDASAISSSSSSLTTEALALLVLVEALEVVAGRPFRGGGSCCMVSSAGSSLVAPRLRLTGGGESSTGCSSSSVSGTPLRAVFGRAEVRVRVADGGFFALEGCFSTAPSVVSPSTSDRPRFLRDADGFSSGGTEVEADRVARRGGIGGRKGVEIETRHLKANCFT